MKRWQVTISWWNLKHNFDLTQSVNNTYFACNIKLKCATVGYITNVSMICHEDGIDEDSIHLETVFSISTSPESITNGRIQLKHTYPKAANFKKKKK